MSEKIFNCNVNELVVITGILLNNFEKDKKDFISYSPIFEDPFLLNARYKYATCHNLISKVPLKEFNSRNAPMNDALIEFSKIINNLEYYLKLYKINLNLQITDFGFAEIKDAITHFDVEKILFQSNLLIKLLRSMHKVKNTPQLFHNVDSMASMTDVLSCLQRKINSKRRNKNIYSDDNICYFNQLWEIIELITKTGRQIYRNSPKLKFHNYMLSHLYKKATFILSLQTPAQHGTTRQKELADKRRI